MTTTLIRAKKIITMNSYAPEATHVAIRDGRILGVGTEADGPKGLGPDGAR